MSNPQSNPQSNPSSNQKQPAAPTTAITPTRAENYPEW